jgi:virulence-associated protein VagC
MLKKLTAQGPKKRKSYTVTLPIEWIKQKKLDSTKAVELNIVGNKVIISPSKESQERVSIRGDEYSKSFKKILPALYRIGVNEIVVPVEEPQLLSEISSIIYERLIGYEIVEQRKDRIVIKDITKESEEEFDVLLRRIFLLIFELSSSTNDSERDVLRKNINRLSNYCLRVLMKKGHSDFNRTPLYYLVIDQLEKISDEFDWLLKGSKLSAKRSEQLKEVVKIFRAAYELFYKFEPGKYDDAQERAYLLKNEIKVDQSIDLAGMHIHNLARLLNSLYGNLFALCFERTSE